MQETNITDRFMVLTHMGDYLDQLDRAVELNGKGFNKFDKRIWPHIRGNTAAMTKILRKYRNQLALHFGQETFETAMAYDVPHVKLHLEYDATGIIFRLIGRTHRFAEFREIQNKHGLRYSRDMGCCVLAKASLPRFDLEQFVVDMMGIEIEVTGDFDHIEKAMSEPAIPTTAAVYTPELGWAALDRKHPNLFCLLFVDGRYKFRWSYNEQLNTLFSNKSGQLTGIFEVVPGVWSRETMSLALAREALEKAKAIVPTWTFACVDLSAHEREAAERTKKQQEPIGKVVEKLHPDFNLFPFQNEFVRFIERNQGNALIGAEMGLGKTIISLSWAAAKNKKVLVVCPKVVRRTWIQEAEKFFPGYFKGMELRPDHIKKYGMPDLRDYNIAAVNFASLYKFMPAIKASGFDTLVIDESHYIKNENALITDQVYQLKDFFQHKILLSGTAIKNRKSELFTQVELIRPGTFESKEELRDATIGGTWNKMQDFYMTRSKHEVLKDLPEKIRSIIDVDVPSCPGVRGEMSDIGDISRLKAAVAVAKAKVTVDFVREILETSDSAVLVFSDSVEAATEMADSLGGHAILHHGQMRDDAREQAKTDFQNGRGRVFVSTRQSLAVGATLTRADKVVFNDLPWTPSDIRQAEDRVHRIGQKSMVNVYWLKAANNDWDSNIIDIISQKFEISKKILEGKQVTAEDRAWMEKPVSIFEVLEKIKRKIKRAIKKSKRQKTQIVLRTDFSKDKNK